MNTCTMSRKDPWGCWLETLWRSSQYDVFLCGKKTLMNFYEDREEEGEEDIEVRRRRKRIVLMSQSIRFQTFFLYTQAFFYII